MNFNTCKYLNYLSTIILKLLLMLFFDNYARLKANLRFLNDKNSFFFFFWENQSQFKSPTETNTAFAKIRPISGRLAKSIEKLRKSRTDSS